MQLKYKCSLCNKSYNTKECLESHYCRKHKDYKPNTQCEFCKHECNRLAALTKHLRLCLLNPENKNKEKRFKCCWCNECFITKNQLKEHKHEKHPEYQGHTWNKGLTKDKYELVKNISNKISKCSQKRRIKDINLKKHKKVGIFKTNFNIRYCKDCNKQLCFKNKSGYCQLCSPKHTNIRADVREKLRQTQLKLVANGTHKGWNARNIKSYAEIFFEKVLNNNHIQYKREKKVGKYFLDFVIDKLDLEIDGKQHEYVDRKKSDLVRDEYLRKQGYFVYRIKWNEINTKEGKEMMKDKIDLFLSFLDFLNCPIATGS